MALATAVISFDISDLVGAGFDASKVRAWTTTNADNNRLLDTAANLVRVGDGKATVNNDGTGSFDVWVPGPDGNPTSWQQSFIFEYPLPGARGRTQATFGPYTISGSANLADLEAQQAIPPTYLSEVTGALSGYVDDAADSAAAAAASAASAYDISNISTSDGVVSTLVGNPDSDTAVALATSIGDALPPTPVDAQHQTVILFGTSQEAANLAGTEAVVSTASPDIQVSGRSWANWTHAHLDHQTYTSYNAGVSGNRYDQMLARMSTDVLARPSDWVWIGGATNDIFQDRAASLIIADLAAMVAAIVADGRRVLVLTTAGTVDTNTTGRRAALATLNAYVATLPSLYRGRVVVADAFGAISNPTTTVPLTNLTHDGTHYSDVGSMLIARRAAEAVRSVMPPPVAGSRSEVGRPATTQVLSNPFLTSTGWTVASPATGSWAVPGSVALTYAAAGADITEGVGLSSPLTTGFAPTNKVRLRAVVEWRAAVPLTVKSNIGPQAWLWPRKADDSFDVSTFSSQTASAETEIPDLLPTSGRLTVMTPWYQVGATVDRIYAFIFFSGISAGWVRISDPEMLVKP